MNNRSTGEFIKKLRKEKNMSQQKLAELTRIDRTTITKYETGEREPNYYNLVELSKVLEVSVTELIAGSRKINDYDKVDNAFKSMFTKIRQFRNIVKILITIFVLVVISLLIYIIVLNYTATKVYKVYVDSANIIIKSGILVKTKDRMYLTFPIDSLSNEVDKINIYYKSDNRKEYIYQSSKLDSAYFSDKLSYEEYKSFNQLLKNIYLELESKGTIIGVEKLSIKFDYTNKNVDNDETNNEPETQNEDNDKNSEIYYLVKKFIKKSNNKIYKTENDKINYEVFVLDNEIKISYTENKINYTLIYKFDESEEKIYLQKRGKVITDVYFYNISEETCETSSCNRYKDDLKLIKTLIEKLKN